MEGVEAGNKGIKQIIREMSVTKKWVREGLLKNETWRMGSSYPGEEGGENIPGIETHSKIRVNVVLWGDREKTIWLLQKELEENSWGRYFTFKERLDVQLWSAWSADSLQLSALSGQSQLLRAALTKVTPFLEQPASGDRARLGYRGPAVWPCGGHYV